MKKQTSYLVIRWDWKLWFFFFSGLLSCATLAHAIELVPGEEKKPASYTASQLEHSQSHAEAMVIADQTRFDFRFSADDDRISYDKDGYVTSVRFDDGTRISIDYQKDETGNITAITVSDGTTSVSLAPDGSLSSDADDHSPNTEVEKILGKFTAQYYVKNRSYEDSFRNLVSSLKRRPAPAKDEKSIVGSATTLDFKAVKETLRQFQKAQENALKEFVEKSSAESALTESLESSLGGKESTESLVPPAEMKLNAREALHESVERNTAEMYTKVLQLLCGGEVNYSVGPDGIDLVIVVD